MALPVLPHRVELAEIDRQRSLGWPDFHPEDYCHRCGGRNVPSWFTAHALFNEAFGPPETHPHNGIVCPSCFVTEHERQTGSTTTWELRRWVAPSPASDPEDRSSL